MYKNYFSERTGNIKIRIVKYSTIQRKNTRYICYDSGLGLNIYEELYTNRKYAITDSELFKEV